MQFFGSTIWELLKQIYKKTGNRSTEIGKKKTNRNTQLDKTLSQTESGVLNFR